MLRVRHNLHGHAFQSDYINIVERCYVRKIADE